MGPSPHMLAVLDGVAAWLRLLLILFGAVAIVVGAIACVARLLRRPWQHGGAASASARLELARYLALALEFQLAADVIESSIAPDWTTIGRLAAIGAIRTGLNYFLSRDMDVDRRTVSAPRPPVTARPSRPVTDAAEPDV